MAQMNLLKSADIKAAANVQSQRVVAMLRRAGKLVPPEGHVMVSVGFSAAYALYLHEKREMKWKGLPRSGLAGLQRRKRLPKEGFIKRALSKMGLRKDYKTRISNLRSAFSQAKSNAKNLSPEERQKVVSDLRKELQVLRGKKLLVGKKGVVHKGFYWDPQDRAQPQFLVGPFREKRKELAAIIKKTAMKTGSMEAALVLAGLRLQREAQQRVPVEFGFLKASAFTVVSK